MNPSHFAASERSKVRQYLQGNQVFQFVERIHIKEMNSFAFDPTVLPRIPERKGTLLLRSDHMKYDRATLNSNWHADREAEPKDYDFCKNKADRNLLRATYNRIGDVTDGSMKDAQTTQQEAMNEVRKLKSDFETRNTQKSMVSVKNFERATSERETGKPERGYNSVLPRHQLEHGMRHLETTQRIDFQYPFEWTPKPESKETSPEVSFHHGRSEFSDTDDHRRPGLNTWLDCSGSVRNYM